MNWVNRLLERPSNPCAHDDRSGHPSSPPINEKSEWQNRIVYVREHNSYYLITDKLSPTPKTLIATQTLLLRS